ncbi:MAG: Fe-S cluster assembly protein SufD [Demequinaceae bacterium]|nr:Fe-S cluster assembly protein SufD [Demequinaceae bacterium]
MTKIDHSKATLDSAHSHGVVPDVSRAARKTSFDVEDLPVPTGREEDWRFTPVSSLRSFFEDTPADGHVRWVVDQLPAGVSLTEVDPEEAQGLSVRAPGDRVSALAAKHTGAAMVLDIAPSVEVAQPVEIGIKGTGDNVRGQFLIEVGARASATVILDYQGSAKCGEFVSVDVADGASLTLVVVQECDQKSVHLAEWVIRLGRGSKLHSSTATLGGALVRMNTSVAFAGEDSRADLFGVYFANSGQHIEHRTFIDHESPRCRSRVTYKGALAGETARTVWVGDVLIRAEAEGTDTYEVNRNLLLTDGTRADSVPNLEIETGEIEGAGHASATGRFDDEQMFYLQSRGISEHEARRLVVRGFFADVIQEMGVPRIERDLLRTIEARLEDVDD